MQPSTQPVARFRTRYQAILSLAGLLLAAFTTQAAPPADPAARAALIGVPTEVIVQPAAIDLTGPRAMQQIVVTGRYSDGTVRDLTTLCDLALETANVAKLASNGF